MVSALGPLLDELASAPAREDPSVPLRRATRLSYTLGLIHPYLDGNGHVQRLAFAAAVMASPGLRLRGAWTAHPRPYDAEAMMRRFEVADVGEARRAPRRVGALRRAGLRPAEADRFRALPCRPV